MRMLAVGVMLSAVSAFGFTDNKWQADASGNWNGKWSDTAHWSKGRVPNGSADDNAIFDNQSVPYTVEVDGDYVVPGFFKIGDSVPCTGTEPVSFVGNGSIRQTPGTIYIYAGREVCYGGNVTVGATLSCSMQMMAGAKMLLKGSASLLLDGALQIGDGVQVCVSEAASVKGTPTPASCTTGMIAMSGGVWRSNASIPAFPAGMTVDISGGHLVIPGTCADVRFLPKGAATTVDLIGSDTGSFKFASAFTQELSGTFANTNGSGNAGFRFDAQAEVYGGGKLFTDWYLPMSPDTVQSVMDVSHLSLRTWQYPKGNCQVWYPSDMTISGHGDYTWLYVSANANYFEGEVTFDTLDTFDRTTCRNLLFSGVRTNPGSSFKVLGGGTQTLYLNEEDKRYPTVRAIEVGAESTLKIDESSSERAVDAGVLRLGVGSTLAYKPSRNPIIAAEADVAADAKIELNLKDFTATQEMLARPLFMSSFGTGPALTQFTVSNNSGWEVKSVGDVIYAKSTTAETKPNPSPWRWTGAVSSDWSDGRNWAYNASYGPGGGANAYFTLVDSGRNVIDIPASGAQINRIIGGGVYSDDTHTADWYRNGEPFVFRGGKLTIYGTGAGDYNSSVFTCSKCPLTFECPVNANALGVIGYSYVAFKGGLTATELKPVGEVRIGGAATVNKVTVAADTYTSACRYTTLTVLPNGVFKTTQTSNNSQHLGICVLGGGEATFAETFVYSSATIPTAYQVDGHLKFTGTLNLNAPVTICGTGRVDVAVNASYSGDGRITLKGGVTFSPKSWHTVYHPNSNNGKMPLSVMAAQTATLAPRGDIVYGPAAGNEPTTTAAERALELGRRATLTIATEDIDNPSVSHDVLVTDPINAREMAQIVKTGAGTLTLASADNSFLDKAGVDVRGGTFAWTSAQSLGTLKAAAGTRLSFAAANGEIPALTVRSDVNLDGVELMPFGAAAEDLAVRRFQTVVKVPAGCEIAGTPVLKGMKMRLVSTDAGCELQVRQQPGLMIIVR